MNWQALRCAETEELIAWAEKQPWCEAMSSCAQDARWHAEGDVWTHTKLVLRHLPLLTEWEALSADERILLKFTALFHDIAKPLTTQLDPLTGHITSPKHAVKGEQVARNILRDLGCDLGRREAICALVRYHGRPAFLLDRAEPSHEVVKLSWLANNKLLYLFALADTRGRDTDALSRPEENLHLFRLAAEESDCLNRPFAFANDHARFLFFRQPTPDLHYIPHEDYSCTATLLSGLPGSGKDHWIAHNKAGMPTVSLDEIRNELKVDPRDDQGRVAQDAKERCRCFLRAGTSFTFNATNTVKRTRDRWIELFASYRARIEIVYLEPEFDQLLQQNRSRTRPVPDEVIHNLAERCEPPTWAECHRLTWCE